MSKTFMENKSKFSKRTKYKKVFMIYQILDCSIKRRYLLLSIATTSNPINAWGNKYISMDQLELLFI